MVSTCTMIVMRGLLLGTAAIVTLLATIFVGCGNDVVTFVGSGGDGAGVSDGGSAVGGTGATAGNGGGNPGGQGGAGAVGGTPSGTPGCTQDCSAIPNNGCGAWFCDEGIGECVQMAEPNGSACDDGLFCTINDNCQGGICIGNTLNTCGIIPEQCSEVTCDEAAQFCAVINAPNSTPCTSSNQCLVNTTCLNGSCEGTPIDCMPGPECTDAVCNPMTGLCESVPLTGTPCSSVPCFANETCNNGMCQGGVPEDCSALTQGCFVGNCDVNQDQCVADPLPPGTSCDDGDGCTLNTTCTNGNCGGGTTITSCIDNDGCCPPLCQIMMNDNDCNCANNLTFPPFATASASNGGQEATGFGPSNLNDGVDQAGCQGQACTQCFHWVSNSTTPAGAFIQYDFLLPVTVGSIYIDANSCNGGCSNGGRTFFSGTVQYDTGSGWVTAGAIANNDGDIAFDFTPIVSGVQRPARVRHHGGQLRPESQHPDLRVVRVRRSGLSTVGG